jgi:hypothetical protein
MNMRANISIDVSLLAIVLAMYFTKQDQRMILILVATLVTHVILTSSEDEDGYYGEDVGVLLGNARTGPEIKGDDPEEPEEPEEPGLPPNPLSSAEQFKTTVSSGVFDRNISTPQTHLTSSIFPKTSQEANGKLADARGSFFESLVS